MNRILILCCCCLLGLASGCGPLQAPLPVRLDGEQQKSINESWDKTLSPVNRFDNQSLLDILMGTGAYQFGVDKLEFRSEKTFAGGVVVMEIHFERSTPEQDQFTVTVQDHQGNVLRRERYGREQIETTYRELFVDYETLRWKREHGKALAEEVRKLEEYEARRTRINSVFAAIPDNKNEAGQPPKR